MKNILPISLCLIVIATSVISFTQTSCTKTIEKIVKDTVYLQTTLRDTVIITKTVKDTIVISKTDTLFQDKIVRDTLVLGADATLPVDVVNFINNNTATYNDWFNNAKNYYDGYHNQTIKMDAVIVFYGIISINRSFDNAKGQSKLIFASYYKGKLSVTQEYLLSTKAQVNVLQIDFSGKDYEPGLNYPTDFMTKNKLVDTYGQTAFIVRK